MKYLLAIAAIAVSIITYADTIPKSKSTPSCRNPAIVRKFNKLSGHTNGTNPTGMIVDHICSLYNGGLDTIQNMQYQTVVASKLKDRIENTAKGKILFCTIDNSLPYRTVFNCK